MKKMILKIAALAIGATTLFSAMAFAASGYDYYVGTGTVTLGTLDKTGTNSVRGETYFVPLNGYLSYRSYVYISAKNSSGVVLINDQEYGVGYGTINNPDRARLDLSQSGTYRWVSTHRSEKTSNYMGLELYN